MRRWVIRIALVLLLVWFGYYLYGVGKLHEVLIDNKDWSVGEATFTATTPYRIFLDGKEIGDVGVDERIAGSAIGADHVIVVLELDENEEPTGKKVEKRFRLKVNDLPVINIPALIQEAPEFMENYQSST